MWLFGLIIRTPADLAGEVAERHSDGLVAIPCGVLVDERGPRARLTTGISPTRLIRSWLSTLDQ
jgi:hypothetical protein